MDLFRQRRFLPIELVIVLAINIVLGIFSYYAVVMWGLFRG
jgi:hypothetical protein